MLHHYNIHQGEVKYGKLAGIKSNGDVRCHGYVFQENELSNIHEDLKIKLSMCDKISYQAYM